MRKTIYILVLSMLAVACSTVERAVAAEKPTKIATREKFDRGITVQTFMPKGMWFFGGSVSYTEHANDDFKMLGLIKDFSSRGHTVALKPMGGYSFANNMAAGLAFTYKRNLLQIDNVNLSLGDDLSFGVSDIYSIEHVYTGTIFFRNYINLGNSRRFALISDVKLQLGGGQGKQLNGKGEAITGTYTKITEFGLIVSPGVAVFINDFTAVEVSIGVLGFDYKRTEQTTNQIYQGSRQTSGIDFKINLLSVALGITFYL